MSKKDYPRINVLLRQERLARDWSQQDLANHLGVTIVTVNRWERGIQQPSPLFRLKLCKLFEKNEEELGFLREEDKEDKTKTQLSETPYQRRNDSSTPLPDYFALDEDTATPCAEPLTPIHVSSQELSPSYTTLLERSVQQSTLHKHQVHNSSLKHRIVLTVQIIIILFSIALIITNLSITLHWPSSLFLPKHAQGVLSAPLPGMSGPLLYQAQWSKDRGGWIASSHWHWSDQEGGLIATDSMTNSMMLAPYQVVTPAYAIEVTMQRLSYTALDGNAFGIVIGKTPINGAICGIGNHEKPEHFFIGQLATPVTQSQPHILEDLFRSPFPLDTQWHTYRVEITPASLRFFFEKKFIGQITNDIHIQEGQVGIYTVGAFVRVKRFMVFSL